MIIQSLTSRLPDNLIFIGRVLFVIKAGSYTHHPGGSIGLVDRCPRVLPSVPFLSWLICRRDCVLPKYGLRASDLSRNLSQLRVLVPWIGVLLIC